MVNPCKFESELTFVIQGPNLDQQDDQITSNLIMSIRKYFPKAPIIFSTWDGEKIELLPYLEKIVFSPDPGANVFLDDPNTLNNVNRQIISTIAGLNQVETKYAVKLRSDLIFTNNKILASLCHLDLGNRNPDYAWLKNYVLVSNQTSVNPRLKYKYPYTICDWFSIGRTEDLRKIWDIRLMPDSWFQFFKDNENLPTPHPAYLSRYFPETYITSTFIRKYLPIVFDHSFDISNNNIEISEKIISNNFIIFSNWQLGIRSQKHNKNLRTLLPMYTFTSWKRMSKYQGINVNIFKPDLLHLVLNVIRCFSFLFIIEGKLKLELNEFLKTQKSIHSQRILKFKK